MKKSLFTLLAGAVAIAGMSSADAALARFVQITKVGDADNRFHLGELEAFINSTVPDDAGGGTFGGLTTSTNDAPGTVFGSGNILPTVGTTSSLEHGGANAAPDNAMQSGGAVWSTNNTNVPQYTLDLGATVDVTLVRGWPRADGCCSNRWRNLEVNLFADAGGAPGSLVATNNSQVPTGNQPLQWTFAPVPEPSTFALFGLAGAALMFRRRR